jgi:hypothetical protein
VVGGGIVGDFEAGGRTRLIVLKVGPGMGNGEGLSLLIVTLLL